MVMYDYRRQWEGISESCTWNALDPLDALLPITSTLLSPAKLLYPRQSGYSQSASLLTYKVKLSMEFLALY